MAIFVFGVFAWSFVEYLIHGWLAHTFKTFATPLHQVHHRDPHAVFTIGAWVPISILWLLALALLGFTPGTIFSSGIVAGFIAYEVLHYRIHFRGPCGAFERRLRLRHLVHHHRNPNACFGVTSELWDLVFGTESPGAEMDEHLAAVASVPPLSGRTNLHKITSYVPLWSRVYPTGATRRELQR